MKSLLPVLVVLSLLLAGAFAAAVGVVMLTTGSCSRSTPPVGVVLIYEVDRQAEPGDRPVDMETLIAAIELRINQGWYKSARVRQLDDGRIEVGVFGDDPKQVARIERLLESAGTLEFRILANQNDHASLIERARRDDTAVQVIVDGEVKAWWVPLHDDEALEHHAYLDVMPDWESVKRTRKQGSGEVTEVLVVRDPFDVTGDYLKSVSLAKEPSGRPCVGFVLDPAGAKLFGALTSDNLPDALQGFRRRLGIIVDGRLRSAPAIQTPVFGRGQITGSFTRQEAAELVDVLNAGSLPAAIRQVEKRKVGTGP